jgi:hypothetical protein
MIDDDDERGQKQRWRHHSAVSDTRNLSILWKRYARNTRVELESVNRFRFVRRYAVIFDADSARRINESMTKINRQGRQAVRLRVGKRNGRILVYITRSGARRTGPLARCSG